MSEQSIQLESQRSRGAYDAWRTAALSGVPASKLHYWARTGFYVPSVSAAPRVRLWSWPDLLALRAIDWLRLGSEHSGDARVHPREIKAALLELAHAGVPAEMLSTIEVGKSAGKVFYRMNGSWLHAAPDRQSSIEMVNLVSSFSRGKSAGPDLVVPKPLLRIIPGKLHGEPHIRDTRIPTATLHALALRGYSRETIAGLYPDLTVEELLQALDFEASLPQRPARNERATAA